MMKVKILGNDQVSVTLQHKTLLHLIRDRDFSFSIEEVPNIVRLFLFLQTHLALNSPQEIKDKKKT